jgi:hypothetical protein
MKKVEININLILEYNANVMVKIFNFQFFLQDPFGTIFSPSPSLPAGRATEGQANNFQPHNFQTAINTK